MKNKGKRPNPPILNKSLTILTPFATFCHAGIRQQKAQAVSSLSFNR